VKAGVSARLDLWYRDLFEELALRSNVQTRSCPTIQRNKTTRATRRAAKFIHKQHFARAASLAAIIGVADVTPDTLESMRQLFPAPFSVPGDDMLDYYNPAAPSIPDNPPISIDLKTLRSCLADAPPLSSSHKDG